MHDSDASSFEELIIAADWAVEQTTPARWHEAHPTARPPTPTPALWGTEYLGVLAGLYGMSLCW
jgi:hypothetical protein